ncbi:large subunit ribosomal protein L21 [Geosmithia morbida]|uniref:Large ribosomal subunit protein bL21m n=1 Tax=Geosmithia morbida TaxID=1094350 RepID=A0A9P4YSU6_9HYPO|nr:large subunit ribosomal protein L21 [Geosmithia morbida]KAF4122481.1 large subunit ribosomal protein L21 [Geosmithia morbida]
MSRTLFRSALELGAAGAVSRPITIAATSRSFFTSTASVLAPPPSTSPSPRSHVNNAANPTRDQPRPLAYKKSHPAVPPRPVSDSVRNLLPFLAAQPNHYVTVHIHGFPYLVQEGDQIRLPFRMPGVLAGDVLRLNRATVLGSRDYTLRGSPHVDESLFECRATVVGLESEPLRIKSKTKRRQRRVRTVQSKHRYTILRISELTVNNVEDIDSAA